MKDLKQKALITVFASAMFMTACSTTATEAPETTAAPTESTTTTTEATTEATTTTTQETTEATTMPTYTDDMLPMTIDEVTDAILKAMGDDYKILLEYDPENEYYCDPKEYSEKNKTIGVVNLIGLGGAAYRKTVDEYEEYDSSIVFVTIVEFDMDSEEYQNLVDNEDYIYYFGSGDSIYGGVNEVTQTVTAINKQYVISITSHLAKGKRVDYLDTVTETEPPFTVDQAQVAYDTFVALK